MHMQNNNKILVSLPNGTCRLVTHTLKVKAKEIKPKLFKLYRGEC